MPVSEAQKKAIKKYNAAHPELIKEINRRSQKAWYERNREEHNKKMREYYYKKKQERQQQATGDT